MPKSVITETVTWADGFGNWHAAVHFHGLSVNDPRPVFSLDHQWPNIRRAARRAMQAEITAMSERRDGSHDHLGKIEFEKSSDTQGFGILYSVTFKESA
jgi:hypothetical protein